MDGLARQGQAKEPSSPASSKMLSPLPSPSPSPSPSLSGSIGALGLSVDSVTLSGPLAYGFPIYDIHRRGRVIFSLRELEEGEVWYTENHNSIRRISDTHVLLGESIELVVPEEEDFDVSRGILTFNGEHPLLLEDAQVSAEAEVERLSGMKFYEGIPLSSVEAKGQEERGIVVFTLQQLPDGQPFYFDRKSRLTIARTGNNCYTINGKEFQGAVVRQVLPSDSKILDLVFPHDRKDVDASDGEDEEGSEADEGGETVTSADILQQILTASEQSQAEEEEEIARAMLKEFDERLKGATLRRAQEKRRRLSAMMKQYTADPSSPFYLHSSPLSSSGTIVTSASARTEASRQAVTNNDPSKAEGGCEDQGLGRARGGLVIPSVDLQQESIGIEEDLEEVDLTTPRYERRSSIGTLEQEQEPGAGAGPLNDVRERGQENDPTDVAAAVPAQHKEQQEEKRDEANGSHANATGQGSIADEAREQKEEREGTEE